MKIAYEPHPVSPERKKELREDGYKIVDARFKPDGKAGKPKAKKSEPTPPKKAETPPVKPNNDLTDIPSDWEAQPFMSKRSLARKIAGRDDINTGDEVNSVIRAELEKRDA